MVDLKIRRASAEDAQGISDVAKSLSKETMETSGEIDLLSEKGFLLYPLSANDPDQPNYAERTASEHFWVATQDDKVVAFMMAYTFQKMCDFSKLTPNDSALIDFFTQDMGADKSNNIYVAQVGTSPEHKKQGIMSQMMEKAFRPENIPGIQAAFAEVAQAPLKNAASSQTFLKNEFSMPFTRTKDTHKAPEHHRTSGTFIKTFDQNEAAPMHEM